MSQLRRCGWQYFLERIVRTPSRPSVPAVAGQVVHTGTEQVDRLLHTGQTDPRVLLQAASTDADAAVQAAIVEKSAAGWEPSKWKAFGRATAEKPFGEDLQWFQAQGIPQSLVAYVEWRMETMWTLAEIPHFGAAIEVPFVYYTNSGNQVHGWIDRVFVIDGELVLLDIKSGQKPKTSEQLGLYAAALRNGLGWNVTTGYFLYGLKHGEAKLTKPLDLTVWSDERLSRLYDMSSQAIEAGIYLPNPGEACWSCSVSQHCEFSQAAI